MRHNEESRKSEFQIFKEIISYGHFIWNDQSIRKYEAADVEVEDLMRCVDDSQDIPVINVDRALEMVKRNGSLEFLEEGKEVGFGKEKCIRGIPSALVLDIAQNKGLDLNDLDFLFGGPILGVLGERMVPIEDYHNQSWVIIVQRFRGVLSVRRYPNYTWKENVIGKQLESLIIDGKLEFEDSTERNENLTLLKVSDTDGKNNYSILCVAEIDGQIKPSMNNKHNKKSFQNSLNSQSICEIKSTNPRYWGCKLPLQMISNNSKKLIYGQKEKLQNDKSKCKLTNILEIERDAIIGRNHASKIKTNEENILHCLKELKKKRSSFEENKIYLLKFDEKMLIIEDPLGHEYDDCQIKPEIVNSLLS